MNIYILFLFGIVIFSVILFFIPSLFKKIKKIKKNKKNIRNENIKDDQILNNNNNGGSVFKNVYEKDENKGKQIKNNNYKYYNNIEKKTFNNELTKEVKFIDCSLIKDYFIIESIFDYYNCNKFIIDFINSKKYRTLNIFFTLWKKYKQYYLLSQFTLRSKIKVCKFNNHDSIYKKLNINLQNKTYIQYSNYFCGIWFRNNENSIFNFIGNYHKDSNYCINNNIDYLLNKQNNGKCCDCLYYSVDKGESNKLNIYIEENTLYKTKKHYLNELKNLIKKQIDNIVKEIIKVIDNIFPDSMFIKKETAEECRKYFKIITYTLLKSLCTSEDEHIQGNFNILSIMKHAFDNNKITIIKKFYSQYIKEKDEGLFILLNKLSLDKNYEINKPKLIESEECYKYFIDIEKNSDYFFNKDIIDIDELIFNKESSALLIKIPEENKILTNIIEYFKKSIEEIIETYKSLKIDIKNINGLEEYKKTPKFIESINLKNKKIIDKSIKNSKEDLLDHNSSSLKPRILKNNFNEYKVDNKKKSPNNFNTKLKDEKKNVEKADDNVIKKEKNNSNGRVR
ncbi:hypothetical protein [Spiroplasma endosymbiont of Aspidapion aeneum]|uniref:hypothetical protein n=1 Tax=Spiroplasma endosymbiont of Aspidapion aeneum TaxID=3066276 RepID=UPI00313AE174